MVLKILKRPLSRLEIALSLCNFDIIVLKVILKVSIWNQYFDEIAEASGIRINGVHYSVLLSQ